MVSREDSARNITEHKPDSFINSFFIPIIKPSLETTRQQQILISIALILLCISLSSLHWLRISSFWDDPARWLFECWRASKGQVPYRDFTWQYPPLSIWVISGAFRVFGATFTIALVVIDLCATIGILATWRLARRLVPESFAVGIAAFIAVGLGTILGPADIFSLTVYTPAYSLCFLSIPIYMVGIVDYLRDGTLPFKRCIVISIGAFLCLLSKPEAMIVVFVSTVVMAFFDRYCYFHQKSISQWLRHYLIFATMVFLPAALVYIVTAIISGPSLLWDGITAYGQISIACPLWPTGYGMCEMVSELGFGVFIVGMSVWISTKLTGLSLSGKTNPFYLLILSFLGLFFYADFFVFVNQKSLMHSIIVAFLEFYTWLALDRSLYVFLTFFIGIPMLLNVLRHHNHQVSPFLLIIFLISVCSFASFARGLFDSHLNQMPDLNMPSSSLLGLIGIYVLLRTISYELGDINLKATERFKSSLSGRVTPINAINACVFSYIVIIAIRGFTRVERLPYVYINTRAGGIRVRSDNASADTYYYILNNVQKRGSVLDIAYGGGANFAAHIEGGVMSTQFQFLRPSKSIMNKDLSIIKSHPPDVIISNAPFFRETSYGVDRNTACPCPKIVWVPYENHSLPGSTFPVLNYIQREYEVVARIDGGLPPSAGATFSGPKIIWKKRK